MQMLNDFCNMVEWALPQLAFLPYINSRGEGGVWRCAGESLAICSETMTAQQRVKLFKRGREDVFSHFFTLSKDIFP